MKTRTVKLKAKATELPEDTAVQAQPSVDLPPQLFILPNNVGCGSSIVSLVDYSNSSPRRYLFCPYSGVHELKRIAAPRRTPKSWLLSRARETPRRYIQEENQTSGADMKDESLRTLQIYELALKGASNAVDRGYVVNSSALFVATPLDPLFLLSPIFDRASNNEERRKPQQFLSTDDHLDCIIQASPNMSQLLENRNFREALVYKLGKVSQTQVVGDETYYKPDPLRLLDLLVNKATLIASNAWPSSLEEEFVSKPLFIPNQATTKDVDLARSSKSSGLPQIRAEIIETHDEAFQPPATNDLDQIASTYPAAASEDIIKSLRLRTALNFILRSYFSKSIQEFLKPAVALHPKLKFALLDAHLENSHKLRTEAQALRSLSENISRKRALDDDELAEAQAEKKLKKEEEDKKKKAESRALKDLKKVDTSGMKKLSNFFAKALPKS